MTGAYTRVTGNPATVVTTSDALQALAHPLRLRLVSLLRRDGAATASSLGRAVGESSGSTSYHLRQLARFGLVELHPEQPNKRDKLWRTVHDSIDVSVTSLGEDPVALAALDRIVQLQVQRFGRHASAATRLPASELAVWADAMASSDAMTTLTPALLAELRDDLLRVLASYERRSEEITDDPAARPVSIYLGAVPLADDGTGW